MPRVYLETSFVSACVTSRQDLASRYRREGSLEWCIKGRRFPCASGGSRHGPSRLICGGRTKMKKPRRRKRPPATPTRRDPLVEEVRRIRAEISREYGHDLDKLCDHLREVEA